MAKFELMITLTVVSLLVLKSGGGRGSRYFKMAARIFSEN